MSKPAFEPIAIVGRDALFPGASSATALGDALFEGRDLLSRAPEGRWRLPMDRALVPPGPPKGAGERDRARTDRGGYVEGFEARFDPNRFQVPASELSGLDPLFLWALELARGALDDVGGPGRDAPAGRRAAVLGLLSFPSGELARFAEQRWGLEVEGAVDPRNRFMSGLPALLLRDALGLDGGAFSLDAACASSLYAVKLACDMLHDDTADLVLAGAVNRADDLFIHVGFTALDALSPTGQSRPFHAQANGLVPSEGAGFVALCRYRDAVAEGLPIHGVIRGVGLANDGRGRGLLAPSASGQVRSMQAAFQGSGLSPRDIGMAECHATGTPVGDATELKSLAEVYAGHPGLPLGSVKGNLGHPITAAGMAGLTKILEAFRRGQRPPSLVVDAPNPALAEGPFRLLQGLEAFDGPRRASLSAFGFGGNDAHLLVEAPEETRDAPVQSARLGVPRVAVTALGAHAGAAGTTREFVDALRAPAPAQPSLRTETVELELAGLKFPPKDLEASLPQQKGILSALQDALRGSQLELSGTRTGVYVGMGTDPEVARWGARWRLPETDARREALVPALTAAAVVGTMPNMPANRVSSMLDLHGPSFTVSAEQASGLVALRLAARALAAGEIDLAIVGAADFSSEPVHAAALNISDAGDGVAVLVLARPEDAPAPWAQLEVGQDALPARGSDDGESSSTVANRFGRAHAAEGLLEVASAAMQFGLRFSAGERPVVMPEPRELSVTELRGGRARVRIEPGAAQAASGAGRRLHVYEGQGFSQLVERAKVEDGLPVASSGHRGPRLVLAAIPGDDRAALAGRAGALGPERLPGRAAYFEAPLEGELGFTFTAAGAAYPGMSRELLTAHPWLGEQLQRRFQTLDPALAWALEGRSTEVPSELLWGALAVTQLHAELTLRTLGLKPSAAIGYSSGESSSLFAFGAWRDLDAMIAASLESGMFTDGLAGRFTAIQAAWQDPSPVDWAIWVVRASAEAVLAACEREARAHVAIIHTDEEVVLAGDAAACDRVLKATSPSFVAPLRYPLAVHVPEVAQCRAEWRALHHREVTPVEGVRFYSHGHHAAYAIGKDACADAITAQAEHRIDFRRTLEAAYADGVRIFVEHGPSDACTRWTKDILGDRPHLAVALDRKSKPMDALWSTLASLVAAGVELDPTPLVEREATWPERRGAVLSHPAHFGPVPSAASSPSTLAPSTTATSVPSGTRSDSAAVTVERPAPVSSPTPRSIEPGAPGSAISAGTPPEASAAMTAPSDPRALNGAHGPASTSAAQPMRAAPRLPSALSTPVMSGPPPAQPQLQLRSNDVPTELAGDAAASPSGPRGLTGASASSNPAAPAGSSSAFAESSPAFHATSDTNPGYQGPGGSPAERAAELKRQLAAAHQSFVTSQAELHAQFLGVQAQAMEALVAAQRAPGAASRPALEPQVFSPNPAPTWIPPAASPSRAVAPTADPSSATTPRASVPDVVAKPATPATQPAARPTSPVKPVTPAAKAPAAKAPPAEPAPKAAAKPKLGDRGPSVSPTPKRLEPKGPTFDREQLKVHASGKISEIFGPMFAVQDDYHRQVRMPEPPLLLADRCTGIDAEAGSMTTGVIWTETDVREDSWYLHEGRMPAGVMIEAGQADLMLISWLGCDFKNGGERIYRLLGCDLTYHGGLPEPGDTLEYEIHIDGHAEQGDIRIFFFHYDCWINGERRLSVRGGQAGFFTDAELANSGGILWDPKVDHPEGPGHVDPPRVLGKRAFSEADVAAYASGDGFRCFGPGFERLATHSATPKISGGSMVFFDAVEELDPEGGPWKRGYLRAHRRIRPDDWFFEGHFKNDNCMPGTLMFEGCLQTMAFYLAGMGYTLDKDGWRFEPVSEEAYRLRCRGQVTPQSRDLIYEVFVEEIWDGDAPYLVADLLCTVDGLKAFHAQRMRLEIIPSWPLDLLGREELSATPLPGARAPVRTNDVTLDLDAMLACAWGMPSRAFGAMYQRFDSARKVPRLPGPPYHFLSRVVACPESEMGAFRPGAEIEVEYDIPADAWYFEDSRTGHMPFAVLLEAALQPCGWLASYIGSTLQVEEDLFFRNLDGTGTLHREVAPTDGILSTTVKLERVAKTGPMIIVAFTVRCRVEAGPVYDMDTVFGFFPGESLKSQAGLPTTAEKRELLERASEKTYSYRDGSLERGAAEVSAGRLALLDEVSGWWPGAGEVGLGQLRSRMKVDPAQWLFKAHFFQDPVQPGSLGIEAMLDALRAAALLSAVDMGLPEGLRFEVLGTGVPLSWKYRGQVMPESEFVEVTLELTEVTREGEGARFVAAASLWVDGKRIYEATGVAARLVPSAPLPPRRNYEDEERASGTASSVAASTSASSGPSAVVFDLESSPWLADHCPTWTVPAVPMMSLLDALVGDAGPAVRVENVRLDGWVLVDGPRKLVRERDGDALRLLDESGKPIVQATLKPRSERPAPLEPIEGAQVSLPYTDARLFHGPAFEVMTSWTMGAAGASAELDRSAPSVDAPVPVSTLDPLLLDGATHAIPHDRLDQWTPEIGADMVAYPARILSFESFGPPPTRARVEARLVGCPAGPRFPVSRIQWIANGAVWAEMELMEATFPKGAIGMAAPEDRKAFLTGHRAPVALSTVDADGVTHLDPAAVTASDWLPGTVERVYGTTEPEQIAVAEHRAQLHGLHPRDIDRKLPCTKDLLAVERSGPEILVRPIGPSVLDLEGVRSYWKDWFGREGWPVEDIYYALIERFVRRVVIDDPEDFAKLKGKSVLFLANHQTMVESLLFSIVVSALLERPTLTLAKEEHRTTWLGTLIKHCFSYPEVADPGVIEFFDRDNKASLPGIIMKMAQMLAANEKAVMIHVEGTRAFQAEHHVVKMSGAFLDLAIQTGTPVVPLRFMGGLPVDPLAERTDFPVQMGKQDIYLGKSFSPQELAALPYGPRKEAVLARLDALGGPRSAEAPFHADPAFADKVRARIASTGVEEAHAVIMEALLERAPESEDAARLVSAARGGAPLSFSGSAEDAWLKETARRLLG